MTRNTALKDAMPLPDALAGRSIVLVGLMGAGKTSIGRRLAARLGAASPGATTARCCRAATAPRSCAT
jgi:tRNA A37 threonylcarbamoyladenosine biosynthesis protein TsaE